ncbi:hypothetical protein [Empedobacter sedimenti]|uniref:hypothetical protein n=1 Tax=Empedobacter sedimenti TaxID=3042610 RepID=UPI0024A78E31|nr:hypothetical protein [Empedobacter sedimenti]
MSYKKQIEKALLNNNWEIIEIDSNTKWWDDEHWKICQKNNPNLHFYLCFIVDPHFEGQRKKGQGICEIRAVSIFPKTHLEDTNTFAKLDMTKDNFDEKLEIFIKEYSRTKRKLMLSKNIFKRFSENENSFISSHEIIFLKNIIDIYIENFLDNNITDDHCIYDTTNILLSNHPSVEIINYIKNKIKTYPQLDLKENLQELVFLIELNLR